PQRKEGSGRRRDAGVREMAASVRKIAAPRVVVGNECAVAQAETLAKGFIVAEQKCFVFADRAAERAAEFVAFKRGKTALIEKIPRIECAVTRKFVEASVKLIRSGSGHYTYLCSGTLAILRPVGVGDNVKFTNAVNS